MAINLLQHREMQLRSIFTGERCEKEGLPNVEVRRNDENRSIEIQVIDEVDERSYASATEVVRGWLRSRNFQAAYGFTDDSIMYGRPFVVVYL